MTNPRQVVIDPEDIPLRHQMLAAMIVAEEAHEELTRESEQERQEAARKRRLDELRQQATAAASVQASLAREALLVLSRYAETAEDRAWYRLSEAVTDAADAALREVYLRDASLIAGIVEPHPLMRGRDAESLDDAFAGHDLNDVNDMIETVRGLRGKPLAEMIAGVRTEAESRKGVPDRGRVLNIAGPAVFTILAQADTQ